MMRIHLFVSQTVHRRLASCLAGLAVCLFAATSACAQSSRLATYEQEGQTYYALSLLAEVPTPEVASRGIAVLVDTSASQTGTYREDTFAALVGFLNGLQSEDHVQVWAVDLEAAPLTDAFVAAKSTSVESALSALRRRTPLGSTDMLHAFEAATDALSHCDAVAKRLVYIGDGWSKASLLESKEFLGLVESLVSQRITVHSLAVGPECNLELMATLANHTGGNVVVAAERRSGQQTGTRLAQSVRGAVLWPVASNVPDTVAEAWPALMPPLRLDRDSILVGTLNSREALPVTLRFNMAGTEVEQTWELRPEPANVDFAYLPKLVELARRDGGLSMPTAGSQALREVRRVLLAGAENLSELGRRALVTGDTESARHLAEAALEQDPGNTEASAIRNAVQRQSDPQPQTKLMQFSGADGGEMVLGSPAGQPVILGETISEGR